MKFNTRLFSAIALGASSALFALAGRADATEWDIYLIGGQSNAAGWGTGASGLPASLQAPQTDVRFFASDNPRGDEVDPNVTWRDLMAGSGNGSSSYGPEISLGRTLADENPDRNIAIVKYAVGGANLDEQWNPVSATPNLYDNFTTTISNAIAALPAGETYSIKGMVWMQGETDAGNTGMTNAYETNLTNLISQVRQDVGVADLPFSIGQLGAVPGRDGMGTVQNAQASVAAKDPNVSLVITSAFGLQSDNLHFTNGSQLELGTQFAAGLQGNITGIQVANASFEYTHVDNDGGINGRNVSGWEESSLTTTGNYNPGTTYYSDTDSLDSNGGEVGTMDETNVLFFANDSGDEYVTQTLSSMAEVGTTYELTVAVGDRDLSSRPNFAGYDIQLLSGSDVLASVASTQSPGDGTFTDISLAYTVVDGDPLGPLGIRLGTSGVDGGGSATDFDNVRLTSMRVLGDFDGDDDVDGDDVDFYIGKLGQRPVGELAQLDLDDDGLVTFSDYMLHLTTLVTTSNGVTGALLGDVNLNGSVDVLGDGFILVGNLGQSSTSRAQGDLSADGVFNVLADGFLLVGDLGNSNSPSSAPANVAVPNVAVP